jgi:hypothetical protein
MGIMMDSPVGMVAMLSPSSIKVHSAANISFTIYDIYYLVDSAITIHHILSVSGCPVDYFRDCVACVTWLFLHLFLVVFIE